MIRDFKNDDTDVLIKIWKAASTVAHSFLSADFIEDEAENLRNIYLVHAQTRVIEVDGRAAGFIAMIGNEIGGLFLDPELHGRGLGRAMVTDIFETQGALEVEVFEQNAVGRRFYKSYGFEQISTSTHEPTGETVLRLACTGRNVEVAA
ncbi:MAG: GNAT family N-acetyltransferase [Pseudoruegeria sp.]